MTNFSVYDEDYFESGVQSGKSGYQNYSWMPELTIRMAHHLIRELELTARDRVLDFGCAKGYLVKALRILDIDAYGVDVSDYAISKVDTETRPFVRKIGSVSDPCIYDNFTKVLAKDVLEHLPEEDIFEFLASSRKAGAEVFIAVPVAETGTNRFVIPQYHNDITHITIKPKTWWEDVSVAAGYSIARSSHSFPGVKENWVQRYKDGNLFVHLRP